MLAIMTLTLLFHYLFHYLFFLPYICLYITEKLPMHQSIIWLFWLVFNSECLHLGRGKLNPGIKPIIGVEEKGMYRDWFSVFKKWTMHIFESRMFLNLNSIPSWYLPKNANLSETSLVFHIFWKTLSLVLELWYYLTACYSHNHTDTKFRLSQMNYDTVRTKE